MKQKKRFAAAVLSAVLAVLLLASCGPAPGPGADSTPDSDSGNSQPEEPAPSPENPGDSGDDSTDTRTDAEKWAESRTMTYLTSLGITPENVFFTASYQNNKSAEVNYVSYQARGDKAILTCYMDAEESEPYQVIYKYGTVYYLGIPAEDPDKTEWYMAPANSVQEFEAARQICKIPTSTEPVVLTGFGTKDPNVEIASLSHMSYRFTLNALGKIEKVRTVYKNEYYNAVFDTLEPCPAGTTFTKPTVQSTTNQ